MIPSIILGMHFESEIGNWFEEAHAWHNRTEPIHTRSGFRMTEIHDLHFDFELPWWSEVNECPTEKNPKTMTYLRDNFSGEDYIMREQQFNRGMQAGRDEFVKISKRYLLQSPVILLVLYNRKRGGPFLQAVLYILREQSQRAPDVTLINDLDTATTSEASRGKYN